MTLVKARLGANPAIDLGDRIQKSIMFQLVRLDDDDQGVTWQIFRQYSDKAWSYADCSLLAIARRLKVTEIFSFDHHIDQMGEVIRVPSK